MLQRRWYIVYVLLVALLGVVSIVAILIPANQQPTSASSSVESLGFYSAAVPFESRAAISNWLTRNKVGDLSAKNIMLRSASFTDTTFRIDEQVYRTVTFMMDSKTPHVSYQVHIQLDPQGTVAPSTTIGCPEASEQRGSATVCQGMLQ